MSDIVTATATTAPAVSRRDTAPDIPLPNGKKLTPRVRFAGKIGASEKAVQRLKFETFYIAGIAYIEEEGSLQKLVDRARRRNAVEPTRRKHRRTR